MINSNNGSSSYSTAYSTESFCECESIVSVCAFLFNYGVISFMQVFFLKGRNGVCGSYRACELSWDSDLGSLAAQAWSFSLYDANRSGTPSTHPTGLPDVKVGWRTKDSCWVFIRMTTSSSLSFFFSLLPSLKDEFRVHDIAPNPLERLLHVFSSWWLLLTLCPVWPTPPCPVYHFIIFMTINFYSIFSLPISLCLYGACDVHMYWACLYECGHQGCGCEAEVGVGNHLGSPLCLIYCGRVF